MWLDGEACGSSSVRSRWGRISFVGLLWFLDGYYCGVVFATVLELAAFHMLGSNPWLVHLVICLLVPGNHLSLLSGHHFDFLWLLNPSRFDSLFCSSAPSMAFTICSDIRLPSPPQRPVMESSPADSQASLWFFPGACGNFQIHSMYGKLGDTQESHDRTTFQDVAPPYMPIISGVPS
ncbi:unnamed protein product [Rangifer tarandus platyrhynchus]|uniref:Uncharacterized protein n=1 Tax=Rangifer tarandus platyrhynchus TaxID=3082113 RepID=A0ABN9A3E3_RANTA|nr:unnamed protein product [Rangifer tarandus platyrhynchus]